VRIGPPPARLALAQAPPQVLEPTALNPVHTRQNRQVFVFGRQKALVRRGSLAPGARVARDRGAAGEAGQRGGKDFRVRGHCPGLVRVVAALPRVQVIGEAEQPRGARPLRLAQEANHAPRAHRRGAQRGVPPVALVVRRAVAVPVRVLGVMRPVALFFEAIQFAHHLGRQNHGHLRCRQAL